MTYYWERMNENKSDVMTTLFLPKIINNENDKFKQEPIKFKLMMNDCVQIYIKNLVIINFFVNKILCIKLIFTTKTKKDKWLHGIKDYFKYDANYDCFNSRNNTSNSWI